MKKRGRGKTQSVEDINRQKARLRAKLPSEPWVEAIVHHGATIPANWLACETRLCQGRQRSRLLRVFHRPRQEGGLLVVAVEHFDHPRGGIIQRWTMMGPYVHASLVRDCLKT
jgi:hypothetical protein